MDKFIEKLRKMETLDAATWLVNKYPLDKNFKLILIKFEDLEELLSLISNKIENKEFLTGFTVDEEKGIRFEKDLLCPFSLPQADTFEGVRILNLYEDLSIRIEEYNDKNN